MKLKIKLLFLSISSLSVYQLSAQLDNNSTKKEKGSIKAIVLNSSKEV